MKETNHKKKKDIKVINSNVLSVNLLNPPNGEPDKDSKYDIASKFFFQDDTLRPSVVNSVTRDANFITEAIYENNPVYIINNKPFVGLVLDENINRTRTGGRTILKNEVNKFLNNDFRFTVSRKLPKQFDLTTFGPPISNQGRLSSCYAHSVSNTLAYIYGRKLVNVYGLEKAPKIKNLVSTTIPSVAYLEYVNQKYKGLFSDISPFAQGGKPPLVIFCLEKIEGLPLENDYSYPQLNKYRVTEKPYIDFDQTTKNYLTDEWVQKKIYPPPVLTKDIALTVPFYLNIKTRWCLFSDELGFSPFFRSKNLLYGLAQKKDKNGTLLWYDNRGTITTKKTRLGVPKYNWKERVKLYKSILQERYAISITFLVFSTWKKTNPLPVDITYSNNLEDISGLHAVVLCGYDDFHKNPDGSRGAFRVHNSWGVDSGDKGFLWLSYLWVRFLLSYRLLSNQNTGLVISSWVTAEIG